MSPDSSADLVERLYTLTVPATDQPFQVHGWTGHAAQAWFLGWLRSRSPALAASLHDSPGRKPYTLSPLYRAESDSGEPQWRLRLTTLAPLFASLPDSDPPNFRYNGLEFPVRPDATRVVSFGDLLRRAETDHELPDLRFRTPTVFHSSGVDVLLPDPGLVIGSLIHSWDSFSPLPLPLPLREFAARSLYLTRYHLRTVRIPVPHKGGRTGFSGWVRYGVRGEADPVALRLCGALLRFAEFAGVGVGTAAGMGQVEARLIE